MKKTWMYGLDSTFVALITSRLFDNGWTLIGAVGQDGLPYPALAKSGDLVSFDVFEAESKTLGRDLVATDERFKDIIVQ